ncbi:phospholipase-like protein [Tanacetum coccineum]
MTGNARSRDLKSRLLLPRRLANFILVHHRIVAWSSKHSFIDTCLTYGQLTGEETGKDEIEVDAMVGFKLMEDMRRLPKANTTPIIADQHFGVSDISGFQSYQKKGKTKKLSPLNLGNTFADENVSGDDVTITGVQQTDNYFNYETVDPDKIVFFWPQLVPYLCTYRRERSWPEGWLSSDHMNSWIQILIRERTENANWTLAKSGTVCLHQENNRFMILTDPHNIGTLDGSVRPFPSWNDVTWVYMPINVGGVHWVTGAIDLADSIFYVFDSMENETRMLMLEKQVRDWTPVINSILETRGYFNGTGRQPHNFRFSYNELFGYKVPQQRNSKDCGVITCWLITKLCLGQAPTVVGDSQVYWDNMRYYMCETFYKCRCEDTEYCGY